MPSKGGAYTGRVGPMLEYEGCPAGACKIKGGVFLNIFKFWMIKFFLYKYIADCK